MSLPLWGPLTSPSSPQAGSFLGLAWHSALTGHLDKTFPRQMGKCVSGQAAGRCQGAGRLCEMWQCPAAAGGCARTHTGDLGT